jgi:hypothetical protein
VRVTGLTCAVMFWGIEEEEPEDALGRPVVVSVGGENAIDKFRTMAVEGGVACVWEEGADLGKKGARMLLLSMLPVRLSGAGLGGELERRRVCLIISTEGAWVGSL